MKVVELHPEDLLDKLEGGALTGEERVRLESHLRACAECRFEVSVRGDMAEEALAPRVRPAPVAPPAEAPPSVRPPAFRRSRPPRKSAMIAALAAALVTGGALAAMVTEVVRRGDDAPPRRLETPFDAPGRTQQPSRPRAKAQDRPSPVVETDAPPTVADSPAPASPEPAAAAMAATDSKAAAATAPDARGTRLASPKAAPIARVVRAREPSRNPPPSLEAEPPTAASLFAAANRARRYGETARAMAFYRALQEQFPASEESRLSRATVASLALDRGDPGAALEGFDRYLEQGGAALGVEALVGRAVALQELGRPSAELAAWKEVARRFPGTVHARRAAARIAALSAR